LKQFDERTNICKICFEPIERNTIHSLIFKDPTICHDCLIKLEPVLNKFYIDDVECLHIYFYTHKIQELLYQFKGCYDYELRTVFLEYFADYLNFRFKGYEMIPAPSTEESDKERGFNHVEEMFRCLKIKMSKCIHKTKQIKQADTTGSTIKTMIKLVKQKGAKKVKVLLMSKTIDLEKRE